MDRENGIRNVAHTSQLKIMSIGGKVREPILAGAERMRSALARGRSAIGAGGFFEVKAAGLKAKIGGRETGAGASYAPRGDAMSLSFRLEGNVLRDELWRTSARQGERRCG